MEQFSYKKRQIKNVIVIGVKDEAKLFISIPGVASY